MCKLHFRIRSRHGPFARQSDKLHVEGDRAMPDPIRRVCNISVTHTAAIACMQKHICIYNTYNHPTATPTYTCRLHKLQQLSLHPLTHLWKCVCVCAARFTSCLTIRLVALRQSDNNCVCVDVYVCVSCVETAYYDGNRVRVHTLPRTGETQLQTCLEVRNANLTSYRRNAKSQRSLNFSSKLQ